MSLAEDHATLAALIKGVDRHARAMDAKWGVDRLPDLVSAELAEKFARQKARWRSALEAAYEAKVITGPMMDAVRMTSAAMERAWAALDSAATTVGHASITPTVWDIRLHDGSVAAFVRTSAEALAVKPRPGTPYSMVLTMDEVANIIAALPPVVASVKAAWPGAEIMPPRALVGDVVDEIPF